MFNKKLGILVTGTALLASMVLTSNVPISTSEIVYAQTTTQKNHTVRKGETLFRISKQYNVTVENLKKWNNLKNNTIKIGAKLKVYIPIANSVKPVPDKSPSQIQVYTVKKGDTLYRIALNHKINIHHLKEWNALKNNTVYVGQKLKVQKPSNTTTAKPIIKPKVISSSFKTLRYYDTNVHVYISNNLSSLAVSTGREKVLEPLSKIYIPNAYAKVNLGMFSSTFEHGGMYLVNGNHYKPTRERYISLIYNKTGKLDVRSFGNSMGKAQLDELKNNTRFVVGTSYSLVQDGKKNLQNSGYFTHSNQRNPRSMVGQTKDGRFILAVTDGRISGSKGLTAAQSADVMLKIGAVEAVNLDGGGSSTLIVGGKIKNRLAGGQRSIGSALAVVK